MNNHGTVFLLPNQRLCLIDAQKTNLITFYIMQWSILAKDNPSIHSRRNGLEFTNSHVDKFIVRDYVKQ
ncbi:protein of unknown function [Methylococcus capsulatus]|uniref:Uncharacterized protein n=1 Tax=Methylococcus capsulatus TaxID=414 RepID=A0AA35UWR8_METCP|nr:protein of unknown function [Methylococcus capsulatus]